MAWSFRPPLWSIAATLAGGALLLALGCWQLERGRQKQSLLDQYAARRGGSVTLRADSAAEPGVLQEAQVRGHYLSRHQLLLDNQTHAHQPGYHLWTPLRLDTGGIVLINRGWLPLAAANNVLPVPAEEVEARGLWRELPRPGMPLPAGACIPARTAVQIVNYPTASELACLLGEPVAAGELLLDAREPYGYLRDWGSSLNEFPPQRHYAYAAQWFAFAATLLALFLKLNLKRKPDHA